MTSTQENEAVKELIKRKERRAWRFGFLAGALFMAAAVAISIYTEDTRKNIARGFDFIADRLR